MMRRTMVVLGTLTALALAAGAALAAPAPRPVGLDLQLIGRYESGVFDASAAEIVRHDPRTQRLFVVNAQASKVDVLDFRDPATPTLIEQWDLSEHGSDVNSVDVHDGVVVAVVVADDPQQPGGAVFLTAMGQELAAVQVGAIPDMVTFTPDGRTVLVANEGEPADPYDPETDPEGSVSVIDVSGGIAALTQDDVRTAGFTAFNDVELDPAIRINPAVPTVAQDLEPEYVTVADDSRTAWVALQENNALAVLDVASATITELIPLGRKDHSLDGNGFDASDRDGEINIQSWPVRGIHMPDAIASYRAQGRTYIVTANEGDAREYEGLTDVARLGSLGAEALCEDEFSDQDSLRHNANLGRLNVSTIDGWDDERGCYAEIHSLGARSLSVWTAGGDLVWDSGEGFERLVEARWPQHFSSNHRRLDFDSRSDDKGVEPEGVTVASLWGRTYALVTWERFGGVAVYDVTDPRAPFLESYVNTRSFDVDLDEGGEYVDPTDAGDLGPEDVIVIQAADSPIRRPLAVVANEVSGTTAVFEIVRTTPGRSRHR